MSKGVWFQLQSWVRFLLPSRYVAPYHATPPVVVQKMLQLARVSAEDTVYDIGCGDARLLIAAAQRGAKGVGFELQSDLVREARREVRKAGVEQLVQVHEQDALVAAVQEATVLTLYLSVKGNTQVVKNLKSRIRKETKIVSFAFPIEGYQPTKIDRVHGINIYMYANVGQL